MCVFETGSFVKGFVSILSCLCCCLCCRMFGCCLGGVLQYISDADQLCSLVALLGVHGDDGRQWVVVVKFRKYFLGHLVKLQACIFNGVS